MRPNYIEKYMNPHVKAAIWLSNHAMFQNIDSFKYEVASVLMLKIKYYYSLGKPEYIAYVEPGNYTRVVKLARERLGYTARYFMNMGDGFVGISKKEHAAGMTLLGYPSVALIDIKIRINEKNLVNGS